jgi:hypothetical protein
VGDKRWWVLEFIQYPLRPREAHPDSCTVISTCQELGIAVVAYSYALLSQSSPLPDLQSRLGHGLLTGHIKNRLDLEEGDPRRDFNRFQDNVSSLRTLAFLIDNTCPRISSITCDSWTPYRPSQIVRASPSPSCALHGLDRLLTTSSLFPDLRESKPSLSLIS